MKSQSVGKPYKYTTKYYLIAARINELEKSSTKY